jgi:hypothetical protein
MAIYKEIEAPHSDSIIFLNWENDPWKKLLKINDEKMYELVGECNTCEFFLERTHGQSESLTSKEFAELMEEGVSTLDPQLIEIAAKI